MSGSHRSGERRTDSYRSSGGGHDAAGGGDRTGSGEYGGQSSGAYATGSGAYDQNGGYGQNTGAYPTTGSGASGRTNPGSERRAASSGSGGYRSGSGGYRTGSGSHRIVRDRRPGRRWAIVLAGALAGVGACVLAAFAIMSGVGAGGDNGPGQIVGGAAQNSPVTGAERSLVPDACEIADKVAGKLAPGAERNQGDNYQGDDRRSQCVWGAYTGDRKRQLNVELRAVDGATDQTPTDAARRSFESERKADESGKALLAGQELTEKSRPGGLGDEAYVVYSVDDKQGAGEAVANVRVANVLVTVRYTGSNDGSPLGSSGAMDGAVEAARAAIQGLGNG